METNDLYKYVNLFIIEKSASCAPRTVEYYTVNLAKFMEYLHNRGITSVHDIQRQDYIEYIAQIRATGVKNMTVRNYCRAVSVFSNWLVDNDITRSSFTSRVKMPKKDAAIIVPLSEKEVKVIDDYIMHTIEWQRNRIIIHLMLDCGLRKKEVLQLRCKDVNYEDKYIIINNSKGNKSRILPAPDKLLNMIKSYKPKRIKHRYLLASDTGEQLTDNAIKLLFYKIKCHTGIERLKAHLLRHTFATSFILGGGNMEMLRVLMGHSDYTITQTYLHIASQAQILGTDIYKLDSVYFKNYNNN